MAGNQTRTEQAINWVCATRAPVGADFTNSVTGIDIRQISSRTTVYCRENELLPTSPLYRWFPESVAPPAGVTVLLPIQLTVADPGRWIQETGGGPPPAPSGCPTVYSVNPDGTGPYPTVEAAITAANMDATAARPITVSLCPGRYKIASTLDVTNNAVDVVAESEAASFLMANPGVDPLFRVSAPGAMADAVRLRGLVFVRFDPGTLLEVTSLVTTLTGACVFLGAAAGVLCVSVLPGMGSEQAQFVQCFVFGLDPAAKGALCKGSTLFADCQMQGSPALEVNQTNVQLSRVSLSSNAGNAVRLVGPGAQLTHTDGDVGINGPGTAIEIVGDSSLQLDQVRVRGDVGILTPQGGLEKGQVQLDHCTYDGPSSLAAGVFLKAGSNYYCSPLLDCLCSDPNAPFEQNDAAQVDVLWGNMNVSAAPVADPTRVRWTTSEQNQNRSSVDVYRNDGFNQLRLRTPYTPAGTPDPNGERGSYAWDTQFLYLKKSGAGGWRRVKICDFGPGQPGGCGFAHGAYVGDGAVGGKTITLAAPDDFDPQSVQILHKDPNPLFPIGPAFFGPFIWATTDMAGLALLSFVLVNAFIPGLVTFGAPGTKSFIVDGDANEADEDFYWIALA